MPRRNHEAHLQLW